jgi:hypothetical protein
MSSILLLWIGLLYFEPAVTSYSNNHFCEVHTCTDDSATSSFLVLKEYSFLHTFSSVTGVPLNNFLLMMCVVRDTGLYLMPRTPIYLSDSTTTFNLS